jgi:WD40 repeat protein
MGKIPSSCRKFLFLCCLFCICAAHSQSPVLTTNIGHTGSITSVDVSQDDRYIVSGSEDMTIRLWDHSTGQLIRTCSGHTGIIRQVAFSSDGRQIISCSDDHSLKLWNAFTGKEIRTFRGHPCPVLSFALSPDNRFLVSGGEEDTIRIWDPGTGEVVRKLVLDWEMPEYLRNDADGTDLKPRVIACSFSSDNRRIAVQASALYDSILIWDAASGQRILAFESAGADYEASLAFCREDSLLVGGGPQIVFYDSRTGNEIRKIENGFEVFALSPDERFVAIPYAITDAGTGFELHNLREWSQHIRSLAFTHDGRSLITGCDDHTLHIFQPESFRDFTLQDVQVDGNYALGFRPGDTYVPASAPQCLSLSRDGKYLYTGARSGEVRRWNTEIRKRKGYFSRTHRKGVSAVAAGYGSGYVASGGGDGLIRILDFEAGKEKFLLEAHRDRIASLSFSPDDRWLASGSWDSTIILWDMLSGEPVHTLKGHTGMVTGVEISPDGRKLISSGEDGRIMIWDVNSGTPLQSIDTLLEHITKVGLCPERNLIITANTKGKVRIREADSGEVLQTLPGISFDISRDRSLLAIGERKGSVYVIKLESLVASDGEGCREQYLVNADYYSLFPVEDLVFSQDGRGLFISHGFWEKATSAISSPLT